MRTIPPTLDSCEDPGKVSTITGAPARQSPRDSRPSLATGWRCVIEQTLFPAGPQSSHLENEEIGQDHFRSSSYQHLLLAGHCPEDLAMARRVIYSPPFIDQETEAEAKSLAQGHLGGQPWGEFQSEPI